MQLNIQSLSTHSRQEFCLALKTARERKGITLDEIAEATKIPASLFAALERNDLRHWPEGLFRRCFFRDYVRMIGLPVAEACAEFVRLFSDDEGAELPTVTGAASEASNATDPRLVLAAGWHGARASVAVRLLAALIDAGAVILVAVAIAWVAGIGRLGTTAIVALAYFSLETALFGNSPATWAICRCRPILGAQMPGLAAISAAWKHVLGTVGGGTPEPGAEPERRPWISDARRVGPAPSPRFRARIKLRQ